MPSPSHHARHGPRAIRIHIATSPVQLTGRQRPVPPTHGLRYASPPQKSLLTIVIRVALSVVLRILREFSTTCPGVPSISMSAAASEQRDSGRSTDGTSAKRRRAAAQHVREARDRLTSTTGTRPAFDYELLRQFAQNRLSASLVILLLVGTVGFLSSLWTGAVDGRHLDRRGAGHPRHHHHQVPAVPGRAAERHRTCAPGGCASSCSTCSSGWPGCSTSIHPVGVDEGSGTFMLFVMLLVVAVSSMLASSLPIAVFAATVPVTAAVALNFALQGDLHDYILGHHGGDRAGLFHAARHRLYSTHARDAGGARREGRADRRARTGEGDLRRGAAPRRSRQHRQVALPRADEPRAAHAAQRHPRLLRGDEERDVRPARGAGLQGIFRRHPQFRRSTCSA